MTDELCETPHNPQQKSPGLHANGCATCHAHGQSFQLHVGQLLTFHNITGKTTAPEHFSVPQYSHIVKRQPTRSTPNTAVIMPHCGITCTCPRRAKGTGNLGTIMVAYSDRHSFTLDCCSAPLLNGPSDTQSALSLLLLQHTRFQIIQ
jgi:hypothetical protein